jgi:NhaP-type Na+/H+ or K+/H+ antiporter
MDKKLDPIESVELSWKLTKGYGWTIFLMAFVSFFIYIFGLMLIFVGILPATMWVKSSFASLYQSVLNEKEKPVEVPVAA